MPKLPVKTRGAAAEERHMRRALPLALALVFAGSSCSPPASSGDESDAAGGVVYEAAPESATPAPARDAQPAPRAEAGAPRGAYQYIDESGRVRIAASLDQVPERQRSTATAITSAGRPARRDRARPSGEKAAFVQNADVTIYTTPGCPWCRRAMSYFEQKGIEYTNRDVSSDQEAYEDYLDVTGGQPGVPVIVVGEAWMQGWNATRFDQLLAANN